MRVRRLASIVIAIVVVAACHSKPLTVAPMSAPEGHFAIVLEQSAKGGWAAHCQTGCAWVDVSISCAGCDVRIDASGIGPAYLATTPATGFAFVLSAEGSGGKARALQNVRWTTLSWGCGPVFCRVRLDETGVGGV